MHSFCRGRGYWLRNQSLRAFRSMSVIAWRGPRGISFLLLITMIGVIGVDGVVLSSLWWEGLSQWQKNSYTGYRYIKSNG